MAETQVTIRFDRDTYREFRAECIRRGTVPTRELNRLMQERLEEWLPPPQAQEKNVRRLKR